MRIAINGYMGPSKTGVGVVLDNLLREWQEIDKMNQYFIYLNYDTIKVLKIFKRNFNIKSYGISSTSPILNILWHQTVLLLRLLLLKPDILFIPNHLLVLFKVCPTVVTIHDLIEFNIQNKFNKLRTLYRRFIMPITARRADWIITVSENSKKDIIKYFRVDAKKIIVIPNGVASSFRPLDKKRCKSELACRYTLPEQFILYVGTLDHPGKNSVGLINAFDLLIRKYNLTHGLVLIGRPGFGYEAIIQRIEILNLKDKIVMTGYVPDEDLPLFYNAADVFVFPSFYEGFGLPVIEAMSCGTAVVASNSSSLPEVIGDAGLIVNANDTDEIAGAIFKILTEPEVRCEHIRKGLERSKKFSWRKSAMEYLRVFGEAGKYI
jgi:glycosyltransferase involved in cell wall biosynthesis